MAIARDTSSNNGDISSASSKTWSHTCTGTDLILIVWSFTQSATTTGATYNGVSMTLINSVTVSSYTLTAFYLIAPATGAHDVVVTASGANSMTCIAESFTGASQSGQPDTYASTSSASASTLSVSPTTVANNSWIAGVAVNGAGEDTWTGTGAFTFLAQGGWNGIALFDTNGAITPAGSTAVGYSGNRAANLTELFVVSIAPVVTSAIKSFNGLAKASIKSINGLAIASVKSINSLA